MIAKKSFVSCAVATAISTLGIAYQKIELIGIGAGLAGGIGSATLTRSRGNQAALPDLDRAKMAEFERKFQSLDRNIDVLTERDAAQAAEIHDLADRLNISGALTHELERQLQVQKTQLNLQVRGIQKIQQVNYSHRANIAVQAAEIIDCQAKIAQLNSLETKQEPKSNVIPIKQPTTHLLVDGNAMYFIEKELGKLDYQAIRKALTQGARKVKCKFYLADTGSRSQNNFIAYLKQIGFEVLLFPIVDIGGGEYKTKGDDVQIAIDAVEAAPGDRVILCGGGDADFFPVVNRLKDKGIDFSVVAHLKTTGKALRRAAGSNLIDLSHIISLTA